MANEVRVKISADNKEAVNSLDDLSSKAEGLETGGLGKLASMGKLAFGAVAAGAAAAGSALVAIGSDALDAYANYEQLTGGMKKLFGDAYSDIMDNANQAFETVGMSANQYMDTVGNFSAALISDLGGNTAEAAEVADMAMKSIADNANMFGTNMEDVAQVYKNLSKEQYMTLDNLKLGYGGTKQGMEELIADANEYAKAQGLAGDLTIDSFADQVKAIELIQQKMSISGTTAEEAGKTIQGSMNMAKAAWENLLTGIADPDADVGLLVQNFMSSVSTVLQNVMPVVAQIAQGMVQAIPQFIPQIAAAGQQLLGGILQGVATVLPTLTTTFGGMITSLIQQLPTKIPELLAAASQFFLGFSQSMLEFQPTLIQGLFDLLTSFLTGIINSAPTLFSTALTYFGMIVESLATAVPSIISGLASLLVSLVQAVIDNAPALLAAAGEWIMNIPSAIVEKGGQILEQLRSALQSAIDGVMSLDFGSIGRGMIDGIVSGISSLAGNIASALGDACAAGLDWAKGLLGIASPSKVFRDQVGKWIPLGVVEGIEGQQQQVNAALNSLFDYNVSPMAAGTMAAAGNSLVINLQDMTLNNDSRMFEVAQEFATQLYQVSRSYAG